MSAGSELIVAVCNGCKAVLGSGTKKEMDSLSLKHLEDTQQKHQAWVGNVMELGPEAAPWVSGWVARQADVE